MAIDCRLQSGTANSSQALLTTFSWGSGYVPRDGRFQFIIISHLLPKTLTLGGRGGKRAHGGRESKGRRKEHKKPHTLWRCWNWHYFPMQAHFLATTAPFAIEKNTTGYLLSGEDFTTAGGSSKTPQTRIACKLKYASFLITRCVLINLPEHIRDCFTMHSSTICSLKTA